MDNISIKNLDVVKAHDALYYLMHHNKNFTKKQWDAILDLEEFLDSINMEINKDLPF